MQGEEAPGRKVLRISGTDREDFLQGLVTNNIDRLSEGLVYAALLTPQGKYLADFLLKSDGDTILLDAAETQADALVRRLGMYRLRAKVSIGPTDLHVLRGLGTPPEGALPDPRHASLGWRLYAPDPGAEPQIDWDALRVAAVIPEAGIELLPDDSYILENGFERLAGVDFRKGCYVGQEVTARMKHKTELRKGLAAVAVQGVADVGTPITADGKPVGTLLTRAGDRALAYLRFDRARGPMQAGEARVTWDD